MPTLAADTPVHELELQGDLSSLACIAAVEADSLRQGIGTNLAAIKQLTARISEITQTKDLSCPVSRLDPTTVVVMNRAIGNSAFKRPITQLDEFVKEIGQISKLLDELIRDPRTFGANRIEDLKNLQGFFLSVSKEGAARDWIGEDHDPEQTCRS